MIVSAASTVAPPAKTAKRAKHCFSASLSSSWLQSMVARSVCWRAGASRAPEPSAPSASSQALGDLAGRQQPAARRRQLDGQRQPVDAPADLRDRGARWRRRGRSRGRGRALARRTARRRPRRPARPRPRASRARAARAAPPGSAPRPAAPSGSRLVASTVSAGQAPSSRPMNGAAASTCSKLSTHQQQVLGGQEALGGLVGGLAREHDDRERLDDRRRHILGPLQRGERDEVRAVGEVRLHRARRLQPQARLAHPARAREGQQPHAADAEAVRDRPHVVLTADRPVRRRRQPVRPTRSGRQRGQRLGSPPADRRRRAGRGARGDRGP